MLDFLVGWVKLARFGLLSTNLASLPDYVWIAESLNPTPKSTMSRYALVCFAITVTLKIYIVADQLLWAGSVYHAQRH
jgi:hypothetical protein